MTKPPRISVVVVAYRSGEALLRCLDSLEGADEVIVVNNGEEAPEIERAEALPGVCVITGGGNVGFSAACNRGAALASGDVIVFLNPDTVAAPGALVELAATLEDESVGIVMARLRLAREPEALNSAGNVVHVSGIAWAGDYGEPAERLTELRDVAYASGSAMAIRRDLYWELGGFTDELFMYQEDLELGWRARMRGLRVVVNPRADVYHDYDFARNPDKLYFLERNRLVFLASAYSGRLLVLLGPLLLAAELALTLLAWKEGWLRKKAAGWVWCARNVRWLAQRRRETQGLRRVSDRELAPLLTPVLDPRMTPVPAAVSALNPYVAAYWSLARKAL